MSVALGLQTRASGSGATHGTAVVARADVALTASLRAVQSRLKPLLEVRARASVSVGRYCILFACMAVFMERFVRTCGACMSGRGYFFCLFVLWRLLHTACGRASVCIPSSHLHLFRHLHTHVPHLSSHTARHIVSLATLSLIHTWTEVAAALA